MKTNENKYKNYFWYGITATLNCKACDHKESCTIKDLMDCAKSFEEWLEENAI